MHTDPEAHKRMTQRHKEGFEKKKAAAQLEKGLLIVNTGTGKGKSTAAFGMGMRVLGHGWKLGVVQFIKGALDSAERRFLSAQPNCDFHVVGAGYTWNTQDRDAGRGARHALFQAADGLVTTEAMWNGDDQRCGHLSVLKLSNLMACSHGSFSKKSGEHHGEPMELSDPPFVFSFEGRATDADCLGWRRLPRVHRNDHSHYSRYRVARRL